MEITANASQNVAPGANVLFTNVAIPGNCSIIYQEGSGLVTLRGLANGQCRSRFRITFTGNIQGASTATISAATLLSAAVSQNGETIPVSTMSTTVADTATVMNIGTQLYIDVPTCCCKTISIKNITPATGIAITNANLIVERVA